MYSFCDVDTYQLFTNTTVPPGQVEQVQALLDFHSDLAGLYMGEPCASKVAETYPETLAGVVAYRVYRLQTVPQGIQSESVGSSSISYVPTQSHVTSLNDAEMRVLDMLCGRQRYGSGLKSVSFAGAVGQEQVATILGWPTVWPGWAYVNAEWAQTDRVEHFTDE